MIDLQARSLLSLKIWFAAVVTAVWNIAFYAIEWRFGSRWVSNPDGHIYGAVPLFFLAAVALAIVFSERFREIATAPNRRHHYTPRIFIFIGSLASVMFVGWVTFSLIGG